ncbi:MAG: response regulator transcription factor [Kofleriaceae bacterium]
MIGIVLVDDQTLVRQGIRSLLELTPDLRVVAEAADGEEAIEVIPVAGADVVLLDVRMPKRTGLEVLEALAGRGPPCILLTTFDDDAVALAGLRLGARGFMLKDVTLEQLAVAVRTVAAGGTLVSPAVTARVAAGVRRIAPDFPSAALPDPLTPRELDVLRLIAMGQSNREIGDTLGMAEGTVKNHASHILSKLGVRDRTRAVLKALEVGVL